MKHFGATMDNVVRTRMFVTDISKWQFFAKAHQQFFEGREPATSMYEIKALIDPQILIEIEADAVLTSSEK